MVKRSKLRKLRTLTVVSRVAVADQQPRRKQRSLIETAQERSFNRVRSEQLPAKNIDRIAECEHALPSAKRRRPRPAFDSSIATTLGVSGGSSGSGAVCNAIAVLARVKAAVLKVVFEPGKLGLRYDEESRVVTKVSEEEQAHRLGVRVGMRFLTVGGQAYTQSRIDAAKVGTESYDVTFEQVAPPRARSFGKKSPQQPSVRPPAHAAADAKPDVSQEIDRILNAETALQILGLPESQGHPPEEVVTSAWKRLVLMLHPDKLQRLSPETCSAGSDALDKVQKAKDELRQETQKRSAEVPAEPRISNLRCLDGVSGSRKFEVSWCLPESQDPSKPIEKYEVWGPKYFSEAGEPFDWVLLATLPPLQSSFVIVEEAPTQQDVMWAADRVRRQTLPLAVHAVNGKGPSEPLTFELPWADEFSWLNGFPSALCEGCLKLEPVVGPSSQCSGCGNKHGEDSRLVVRCTECQGEMLWIEQGRGSMAFRCCCCLKQVAEHCAAKQPSQGAWRGQHHQKAAQRTVQWQGGRGGRGGGASPSGGPSPRGRNSW